MDRWSDSSKILYNGSYMNSGTKLSKYMIAVAAAGYKGWGGGATIHDVHLSHIVCCIGEDPGVRCNYLSLESLQVK